MKPSDRRDVLWIGGTVPTALAEAFAEHHLRLREVSERTAVQAAPSARAIILEFDGDIGSFVAIVRRSIRTLVDHGLLVGLCHRHTDINEATLFQQLDRTVLKTDHYRSVLAVGQRWGYLAFRIVSHDPGPGANLALRIDKRITNLTVRLFLQRAFWDFEKLRCDEPPQQGLSGSRVMIVHPIRGGGPTDCFLPKLVKIGPVDDIDKERTVFRDFVRHTVPFNYRPNMDWERYVVGLDESALVQDFVEPAVPLADAVLNGGASMLAASLFDGALGNWRRSAVEATDGALCERIANRIKSGIQKHDPHLHRAFVEAGLHAKDWPDVRKICDLRYLQCHVHGDLHAGNVFVGTTSGDCILIDFAKSQVLPAAIDPAALEVQLAFAAKASAKTLNALYKWPIELPRMSRDWLSNAIRAIRIFGLAGEPDQRAYGLAVADQLLRFGKFPQPRLSDRARAVSLAYEMLKIACG